MKNKNNTLRFCSEFPAKILHARAPTANLTIYNLISHLILLRFFTTNNHEHHEPALRCLHIIPKKYLIYL